MAFHWKVLTSQTTIVIKRVNLQALLLVAALVLPPVAMADDGLSVDARFDKTGNKLVNATDWGLMSELERTAYARASVQVLGEDPDVVLVDGRSRAESYLAGLRAVYE